MTRKAKGLPLADFRIERVGEMVEVYRLDGGYQATITAKQLWLWEHCDGETDHDTLTEMMGVFGEKYVYRPVLNLALHRLSEAGLLKHPMLLDAPPPKREAAPKPLSRLAGFLQPKLR